MNVPALEKRPRLFPLCLLFMTVWLWTGWLAALLKVFHAPAVLAVSLLLTAAAWRLLAPREGRYLETRELRERAALAAALLVILAMAACSFIFFHETFGYRDDAVYATNAIYLARHGDLPYPTLDGADSRLFANTVWLAEFYGLFGLGGMRAANLAAAGIALLCFYLLVRELSGGAWPALLALLLLSLCYPFVWFTRRTVNEVLFFSLCWICFYLAYRCLRPRPTFRLDLALLMLASVLPCFIRPEGLLVLGAGLLASSYAVLVKGRRRRDRPLLLFAVLAVVMLAGGVFGYVHMSSKYLGAGGGGTATESAQASRPTGEAAGSRLYDRQGTYSFWVMLKFGILPALVLVPLLFLFLLLERKSRPYAFYLLLAALPFFYFLFSHHIVPDLPWFLRRFVAVVIPLSMLSFAVVVSRLRLRQALAVSLCYLALTLYISAPVLFQGDRPGTVALASEIAGKVPGDALILTDRYMLGGYDLSGLLRYEFGRSAMRCSPYSRPDWNHIGGSGGVYLVASLWDFCFLYGEGGRIFDESVEVAGVDVVAVMEESIPYFTPTADLNRGAYVNNWKRTDYRAALSLVGVPPRAERRSEKVLLLRLRLGGEEGGREGAWANGS